MNRTCKLTLTLLLGGKLICATDLPTDFSDLIRDPPRYTGKRVAVIAVAAVDGARFVLYRPPKARTRAQFNHEILVVPKESGPRYVGLNNHWVRATGTAYPKRKQDDFYGCILFLEKIDQLPAQPVNDPRTLALFANNTRSAVQIKLYGPKGGLGAELSLGPGAVDQTSVEQLEGGLIKVLDSAGNPLSTGKIPSRKSSMFDQHSGSCYFRIRDRDVKLVPPNDARDIKSTWNALERGDRSQR